MDAKWVAALLVAASTASEAQLPPSVSTIAGDTPALMAVRLNRLETQVKTLSERLARVCREVDDQARQLRTLASPADSGGARSRPVQVNSDCG